METLYPNGYSGQLVTLARLRAIHEPKMHPEYARRFFAMAEDSDGLVGIGGGWRSTEAQRTVFLARHVQVSSGGCCSYDGKRWQLRSGFAHAAPPGASFHESQTFVSGVVGYQAVDIVGRDGRHAEAQAWMRSNEARFGLRSFYDIGNEPWHVQCADTPLSVSKWKTAGRPDPASSFQLPGDKPTPPEVQPPVEEDEPMRVIRVKGDTAQYVEQGMFARWIPSGEVKTQWVTALGFDPAVDEVPLGHLGALVLVGANPFGTGVTTSPADFGGHIA